MSSKVIVLFVINKKTSGSVSRVLSFKATIFLGTALPQCSSHPSEYGPSKPLHSVLLRIGFTGPYSLLHAGELLPRLSTLTGINAGGISLLHCPGGHPRRPLAVILLCEARTFLVGKGDKSLPPQLPNPLVNIYFISKLPFCQLIIIYERTYKLKK